MSTFIEIRREVHPTKRTTFIRLDDDLKVTIRNEEGGVATDTRLNFTGMDSEEGKNYLLGSDVNPNDVIAYVNVTKLSTDERATIAVRTYHAAGHAGTVPDNNRYWYNTKNQYAFGAEAEQGKTEADNPNFGALAGAGGSAQRFSTTSDVSTIFNITTLSAVTTAANTETAQVPRDRLYGQLGSLEARRNHLKILLRNNFVDHPDAYIWTINAVVNSIISTAQTGGLDTIKQSLARPQSFVIWMEMMANVLSIDANLNSEQKFNLLNGELNLNGYNILTRPSNETWGTVDITGARQGQPQPNPSAWRFYRFGQVASSSPWAYTIDNTYTLDADTSIILTGANLGRDAWMNWLRL